MKLKDEAVEILFNDLKDSGFPLMVNKAQYAKIVNQSVSTVSGAISAGKNICKYSKMGGALNAKVLFNLRDVAEFIISQKVEVL